MIGTILVAILLIIGVFEITQPERPLYFVRRTLDFIGIKTVLKPIKIPTPSHPVSVIPKPIEVARWWYYPVLYCSRCMSSLWGGGVYVLMNYEGVGIHWTWEIAITILAVYGGIFWLTNQQHDE